VGLEAQEGLGGEAVEMLGWLVAADAATEVMRGAEEEEVMIVLSDENAGE